jgi:LacI family transcriptional regulator
MRFFFIRNELSLARVNMVNATGVREGRSTVRKGGVRLQDVAQHLGVHPMTVSRALSGSGRISEATRESIRQTAEELGYRPNLVARSLRQGRNPKMVPLFSAYLDSGMNTQKLESIQNLLGADGFETPIHSCGFHNQTGPLQAEMLAGLCAQRPAAIVCNTHLLTPHALEELRSWNNGGGVAVIYDHDLEISCDRVVFDREDAGHRAARHLLELGHSHIGYAHHSPVHGKDERMLGLNRALAENGLSVPEEWVFRADQPTDHKTGGRELAAKFLALPAHNRPSALCLVNDLAALAFIAELDNNGVGVPHDLSIVAHDDQPFAEFAAVPLTTVTHPAHEIAHQVVQVLRKRLSGSDEPRQRVVVRGELIVRASTAAF